MNTHQLNKIIPELLELSNAVSRTIMDHYHQGFDVMNKSDESPVTSADLAADELIVKKLKVLTPEIYILSEEMEASEESIRIQQEWIWCIDPLDGTKEFIAKNGEFSVNIALIHLGEPVLGFVILPAYHTTYYALKGGGVYKVGLNGLPAKLSPNYMRESDCVRALTSRSHHNINTEEILKSKFSQITWVPAGSSLKFTELAEGRADIYLKLGKTMEWDIAAPHLILTESGGIIFSYPEMKPLRYNKPNLANPDFIAWRKGFDFVL